MASTVCVAL